MAKKNAGGAPPPKAATLSDVEREAQELLEQNDNGEIDNVFDIIDDLTSIEERLPATSALRPAWDAFHSECIEIMAEVSGE